MSLRFDNTFVRELPGEPEASPVPHKVKDVCYSRVQPTPVAAPRVLAWSPEAGAVLDLPEPKDPKGWEARVFGGNELMSGMEPYAARYGGHQFGVWAGQLGDGRAITLGEVLNAKNERWEIQLKGAGLTPYSRRADGRAVLRSSLREFICSEAMHFLGVPTTRALCLVTTGDMVTRDMFYDGNPQPELGAICTRLAPTFLRFGNFEILAASGETELLKRLADYMLATHFPNIKSGDYVECFAEICERTARLMVEWQRVGFIHGVMNTDNMSVLGWTIDYGPFSFLDVYDPEWTPNTTDVEHRRYRFSQQPTVALWNLAQFARALTPLVSDTKVLEAGLELFQRTFTREYPTMLLRKLGLPEAGDPESWQLLQDLDPLLRLSETDMTLFYRRLANVHVRAGLSTDEMLSVVGEAFYGELSSEQRGKWGAWLQRYTHLIQRAGAPLHEVGAAMKRVNPAFIPRNYQLQEAIEALEKTEGDAAPLQILMRAMRTPYDENEATRPFMRKRPEWARNKAGASALSCSS